MTNEIQNELQFSDWLAQNIHVLSDEVAWDINPSSVRRERSAWNGSLRVDLFCQATEPGGSESFNVIIENQLRTTDSDHLARILAYISAFDAKGAVWIAGNYTYMHRRVIRWLNDNSEIDAYLFKLDLSGVPSLAPVIYPGMPEEEELTPQSVSTPNPGWRMAARTWFERVLPKVAARCEHLGAWQIQTTEDLKSPIPSLMWCQQPVIHHDNRVSEYISCYIELHPDFVRIGLYIPGSPRDKSHHYFDALTEGKAEMDKRFGSPLEAVIYRGGFKHITWEPFEGVGYECADEAALEREAVAVAYDMERLIEATKDTIADLTPYG